MLNVPMGALIKSSATAGVFCVARLPALALSGFFAASAGLDGVAAVAGAYSSSNCPVMFELQRVSRMICDKWWDG